MFIRTVLLSGLSSILLNKKEVNLISHHYKIHIQRLLKLHQATPAPVVFFIAGCLPLPARLHLRIFSLFGQICRLGGGDNILAKHAANIFSSASGSSKSWFWNVRQLCLQYDLPHPATWLVTKPAKQLVKISTKLVVHQYWLSKLRSEADLLPSLLYLNTRYLGLTKCHPIFRSCGSSPWEVEKAVTQARLLSGRYRLEALSGHWIPWNKGGLCSLPGCWNTAASHKGTVEEFLLSCPSLGPTRLSLANYNRIFLCANPHLEDLMNKCLMLDPIQFWIDCSTMGEVISTTQSQDETILFGLLKLTRNYCHSLHKARCKLIALN